MAAKTISVEEGTALMVDVGYAPMEFAPQWSTWLGRGDIILIFTNEDLGHPECGHRLTMPWYSDLTEYPPPKHAPDHRAIGLGWRYVLTNIITKESA